MIVRADHLLVNAVLGIPDSSPATDEPEMAVWDAGKLRRIPRLPRSDHSYLKDLVPDWMRGALAVGPVLCLAREDWDALDYEVQERLDVIKY